MGLSTYYLRDYASCYIEQGGEVFEFRYDEGPNYFLNIAIKRQIPDAPGFFDIETPYGIGGYIANGDNEFVQRALIHYKEYCAEQHIVAEFLRFSPFNNFPILHGHLLNFLSNDRQTVSVDLNHDYETIRMQYASSLRRNIRKAEESELQFEESTKDESAIANFMRLYQETMDRHDAASFYYFSPSYFQQLFNLNDVRVFGVRHEGELINMVIMLFGSDNHIYYHLGATDPDYYYLNTNPFIFDQIIKKFATKSKQLFMGGGLTGDPEDPLFKFKRKFSPNVLPYYIAGLVIDDKTYEILSEQNRLKNPNFNSKYFLKYRF